MVVHYINKTHLNYPRSACNRLLGVKAKTNVESEVTCKLCLRELSNTTPIDVSKRRKTFYRRSEKVNLYLKGE